MFEEEGNDSLTPSSFADKTSDKWTSCDEVPIEAPTRQDAEGEIGAGDRDSCRQVVGNCDKESDKDSTPRNYRRRSILSFDGGGTKGVTEAYMLNQVMRLATIMWRHPDQLDFLFKVTGDGLNLNQRNRQKLSKLLEDFADEPIHPTEVFDMIVGTSTGSIIAFALGIGVIADPYTNCERDAGGDCACDFRSVGVAELIEMYKDLAPEVFIERAASTSFMQRIIGWVFDTEIVPYTQAPLRRRLAHFFGSHLLSDFRSCGVVVGAVAHHVAENRVIGDVSVVFDTRNEAPEVGGASVVDVLAASADAPFYFVTPAMIGSEKYIDGGVAANCPIHEGIERADLIWDRHCVGHVLSVSPSPRKVASIPNTWISQFLYWLKYFVDCVVSGDVIFRETQAAQPEVTLTRLAPPHSEFFDTLGIDSLRVYEMLEEMRRLSLSDPRYFLDVVVAAVVVVVAFVERRQATDATEDWEALAERLEFAERLNRGAAVELLEMTEMRDAYEAYKRSKKMLKRLDDDGKRIKDVMFQLADTIQKLGKVKESIKEYKKILNLPRGFFKKVQAGEIVNPLSYLSHVTDVDDLSKATILFRIAEHYVHEGEFGKAEVSAGCATELIEDAGKEAAKLREKLKTLTDALPSNEELFAADTGHNSRFYSLADEKAWPFARVKET